MEDILKALGGKWGLLAVAAVALPGGRKLLRSAAKEVIRAGLVVTENVKELAGEIKEEANDVVAEVKAERASKGKNGQLTKTHE